MKRFCLVLLFLAPMILCASAQAQRNVQPDSLGLPGDNLNLYAVLKVFQESPTLEEFEKKLNAQESRINNLDLNGDGKIDYIRVVDHVVDNVHDIVLQIPVSQTESQDVAVIQVQRDAANRVRVQVIGDEALYGKDYIVEPNYDPAYDKAEGETPNPGYAGTNPAENLSLDGKPIVVTNTTPVEVANWPAVRYIYMPAYAPWDSPWYYSYYPPWWRPWRPYFWHFYWGYHYNDYVYYYGHYRRWNYYRNEPGRNYYYRSFRSSSPVVLERQRQGAFQKTYTRPEMRQVGITRYNKLNQGGMTKPTEDRSIRQRAARPGTVRTGTNTPQGNKPSVNRPTGTRPARQGVSRPSGSKKTGPAQRGRGRGKEGRGR